MKDDAHSLRRSFAHCREVTRQHAKSFHFASHVLPVEKRMAAYAVYAFCRYADDLVDEQPEDVPAAKADALESLRRTFHAILDHNASSPPFARAFAATVEGYRIPRRYFEDLIHGVGLDTGRVRIADWGELREYCYYVASVVGLIMARIFGLDKPAHEDRAVDLGIAMQLTNIIRDVGEDFRRDRVYLPTDMMQEAGVSERDLAAASAPPALRALLRGLTERARSHYKQSESGIAALDDDGSQLAVWTMRHVYAGILDEIERADYDVLTRRAHTSLPQKIRLFLKAKDDLARSRRNPAKP